MKTGIITFYNHPNYGAVLQSYALQRALEQFGVEAFHVDFEDDSAIPEVPDNPIMKKIVENKVFRDSHFEAFRKKTLKVKKFSKCKRDPSIHYFVGSDQVWNPEITQADERYFAPFADKKHRHAYACSLGTIKGSKWEDIYLKGLADFDHISVREKSGSEQIEHLIGIKPCLVLDPTMLLKKKDWEVFIDKSKAIEKPYILLIMVQNNPKLYNTWKTYAHENNVELKLITASYFPPVGFEPWSEVTVCDWLNLIYHAQAVVTTSYHGLVFSILFQKLYYVEGLSSELQHRNSRLTELLNLLQLKSKGEVDHSFEKRFNILRTASFNYLKQCLQLGD